MSIFNKNDIDDDLMPMDFDEDETEQEDLFSPIPEDIQENVGGPEGVRNISGFRTSEYFMMIVSLILALILLLTSSLLIYKTHALSVENGNLESRLQRDNKLKKSEEEYETETENLQIETDSLINRYGVGNTPEKTILFLANLSSTTGISVTSIEFGESGDPLINGTSRKSDASEADPDNSSASGQESNGKEVSSAGEYSLSEYQVVISYTGTYAELKKAIKFIEDYGERTTVNNLTATYDETTNMLTGSMTLNMYTLSGTDHKYTAPSVTGSVGTANIFG